MMLTLIICFDTDMGDFENSGKPDPASAHVTPKTAIGGALSGRELRDVLLFLDAVYRGIGPLNLAGRHRIACVMQGALSMVLFNECHCSGWAT
jgi:hypothetical protein